MLISDTNLDAQGNQISGPQGSAAPDPEEWYRLQSACKGAHTGNSGAEWDQAEPFGFDVYQRTSGNTIWRRTYLREKYIASV